MKKFEYKFVRISIKENAKLGFSLDKKIEREEKQWNDLGREGWQFCKEGNGCFIFMRELIE